MPHLRALSCSLLVFLAACPRPPAKPPDEEVPGETTPVPLANRCDPEPAGLPPRPLWTEQPVRVAPYTTTGHTATSLGKVVSCDPNRLGQYPVPEGGNAQPRGADLQNLSTNFHVLQSVALVASLATSALSKLNTFKTALDDPSEGKGLCRCNNLTPFSCITTAKKTREECDDFCNPAPPQTCGGVRTWLPTEVFKTPLGTAKFGSKLVNWLDELQAFTSSPTYTSITQALTAFSAAIDNIADILARLQCWVDLFVEGYHLGGYDEQRPDLHQCVSYYGHGAYAALGEPGTFQLGGRYTSHNLSAEHRVQMRQGGWAVTAFGKTLSIMPNVEMNLQVDDYRFFDKCKPIGLNIAGDPMFNCPDGFGFWVGSGQAPPGTKDVDKIDFFHLMDRTKLQSLDSDGNSVLTGAEFIVAGYQPFSYPNSTLGPFQWPRPQVSSGWEAQVASVASLGLNLNPHITPIEKILGTYVLYPGVTFIPILTLQAGFDWNHEAYKLRSRLLNAVNLNLAPGLQLNTTDFERPMHAFQAPDLTADTGVGVYVTPGVKAQLVVGLSLSKSLELGIVGFVGMEMDIRPSARGGLTDLNLALTEALNNSNPAEGPCGPVFDKSSRLVCSDTSYDSLSPSHSDPTKSYACQSKESASSCCLTLNVASAMGPSEQYRICLDDWTGIPQAACSCGVGVQDCYNKIKKYVPQGARSKIEGWVANQALNSISASWNSGKTCAQCDRDGTCLTEWWGRTIDDPFLSECAKHGYCVSASGATSYDVAEEDCSKSGGTFHRYQCVEEVSTTIRRWEGPGCHPLNGGYPSACGCDNAGQCASGESCDANEARCAGTCACNPSGNSEPAVACGPGRTCVDGACAKACGNNSDCRTGLSCQNGLCLPQNNVPFAEQIVWRAKHPAAGSPRHAVESYALTDILLKFVLSSGVRVGATVKLMGKKFEFLLWKWSDAWDLGSTQKAKFQPGLQASYLDECNGTVGSVKNHQPGSASMLSCTGGDAFVCRYPSSSSPGWANFDEPHELIAQCKNELPQNVEDPPAPNGTDLANSMTDTLNFGIDVGTTAFENHPMCIDGQLMADWAQDPPQMAGTCSYQGRILGAPTSFPCTELEKFSLEVWGCLNTTTPQGVQVKSFLLSHGLSTGYLVAPTYASSLTSAQVVNLQALVVDTSAPAATAQFASPVSIAASSFADEVMLRNYLSSVEQCFESNFQAESVCGCTTSANCDQGAGEVCVSNQCQKSTGALAACPFVKFSQNPEPQPCCGDGQVESGAGETCDDGNRNNGDGCSSDCHAEAGPAACCTPSGCVDMDWKNAPRCTTLQGNLMSGTCAQLNQCGYVVQGSCVDKDGLCHQPVTAEQCTRLYAGTFQSTPCSSNNP